MAEKFTRNFTQEDMWERLIRSAWEILEGLLKTDGSSLSDENLRTLITETEAIIN